MTVPAHEGPARGRGSDRDVIRTTHTHLSTPAERRLSCASRAFQYSPRNPITGTMTRCPAATSPVEKPNSPNGSPAGAPGTARPSSSAGCCSSPPSSWAARRSARRNLPQYDAGQSGQAERVLNQVAPAQYIGSPRRCSSRRRRRAPPSPPTRPCARRRPRSRRRSPPCPATRLTSAPRCRRAARRWCRRTGAAPWSPSSVPGNVTDVDKAVTALQHAVAGVQASHAGPAGRRDRRREHRRRRSTAR